MQVLLSISIFKTSGCCCFMAQLEDAMELSSLVGVLVKGELLESEEVEVANSLSEDQTDAEEVATPLVEAAPESHILFSSVLLP